MDTLHAFTAAGAYTEFMEDRKGTLKDGYLADVVVLDADMEADGEGPCGECAAAGDDLRRAGDVRSVEHGHR